jgi:hypothetical protein
MANLSDGYQHFHSDIATTSIGLEMLREHKFTEDVGEILVEAGELDDFVKSSYKGRGMKIDGYCFDEEFSNLSLIVTHWKDESDISKARVTNTTVNTEFKHCIQFFQHSKSGLYNKIEIANEAYDLARLIHELKDEIIGVRIILITDGIAEKRAATVEVIDGIEFRFTIWDIERILQFIETGEKEIVVVDFLKNNGKPLPYISYENDNEIYGTYLAFIPGQTLADIYSQWGTRVLDMNVRVFLSGRGKINRGIHNTITNEPDMFCAYNNGIAVFARELEFVTQENGSQGIAKAKDFQIVNGGQTVASLYHTNKKQKADLSSIHVQMKVVVINDPGKIDELVPRISEYSNTQNRVSLADLAANNPPHPELHEISKRLPAPDPTGGSMMTYWFYEKARGSWEETGRLDGRTQAKKTEYETKYPKTQRFDKSIFGKSWNTYLGKPQIVSLGAQKNFARFNEWLQEQKEEDLTEFFKKTVALVMLWKNAERVIRRQSFDGYRHNIATYTLSWLFELTDHKIDLDRLWNRQTVDECILEAIESMSHMVNKHIRNTEKNITEWCKKDECWTTLKSCEFSLPQGIEKTYISATSTQKGYDPRIKAEVEIIDFCKSMGGAAWWELAKWLKQMGFLSGKARSQCANMGKILNRGKEPSIRLATPCQKIWEDATIRGWKWEEE